MQHHDAPPAYDVQQSNASVVITDVERSNVANSGIYNTRVGKLTGWLQLLAGVTSIIVACVQLVSQTIIGVMVSGLWSGVLFFIPTGIIGIVSGKNKRCVVIAYLTMSIISAVVAAGVTTGGVVGVLLSNSCLSVTLSTVCDEQVNARIAADSALAVIGFFELIVAIVASVYCCLGTCCSASNSTGQIFWATQPGVPMFVNTDPCTQTIGYQPPAKSAEETYPHPTVEKHTIT